MFPQGYSWLIEQNIMGYEAFSQLQPWLYLKNDECFFANIKWKNVTESCLFAFAKRQDNDELACFKVNEDGNVEGVVLINGWSSNGFDIIKEYSDFWAWFHQVIDDVKEWVELEA